MHSGEWLGKLFIMDNRGITDTCPGNVVSAKQLFLKRHIIMMRRTYVEWENHYYWCLIIIDYSSADGSEWCPIVFSTYLLRIFYYLDYVIIFQVAKIIFKTNYTIPNNLLYHLGT